MRYTKPINKDLFSAAWNGSLLNVGVFISMGNNVNASDEVGYTALHLAAMKGHEEVIKTLIAVGANVNAIDKFGNTPAHYAANNSYNNIVITLLESGAKILDNNQGENILKLAVLKHNTELAKIILDTEGAVSTPQLARPKIPAVSITTLATSSQGIFSSSTEKVESKGKGPESPSTSPR